MYLKFNISYSASANHNNYVYTSLQIHVVYHLFHMPQQIYNEEQFKHGLASWTYNNNYYIALYIHIHV